MGLSKCRMSKSVLFRHPCGFRDKKKTAAWPSISKPFILRPSISERWSTSRAKNSSSEWFWKRFRKNIAQLLWAKVLQRIYKVTVEGLCKGFPQWVRTKMLQRHSEINLGNKSFAKYLQCYSGKWFSKTFTRSLFWKCLANVSRIALECVFAPVLNSYLEKQWQGGKRYFE